MTAASSRTTINEKYKDLKENFITSDSVAESGEPIEYKSTPYRWLILMVVFLCTVCQTMTVMSIAPVAVPVQEAFSLKSSLPVNMCAMSFSLCGVPMTFVAVWAFANYSTNFVEYFIVP